MKLEFETRTPGTLASLQRRLPETTSGHYKQNNKWSLQKSAWWQLAAIGGNWRQLAAIGGNCIQGRQYNLINEGITHFSLRHLNVYRN